MGHHVFHVIGLMSLFYELKKLCSSKGLVVSPICIVNNYVPGGLKGRMCVNKLHFLAIVFFTQRPPLESARSHFVYLK